MKNPDYNGPKMYESQFDMSQGIRKHYPHLIKKTLANECDCGNCSTASCECSCHDSNKNKKVN
jgi:hypothetical protein